VGRRLRGQAARLLTDRFLPHVRAVDRRGAGRARRLRPRRAAGALTYLHVACTSS